MSNVHNYEDDIDGIIASISGDVYDYATDADSDRDEAVYSATVSHKKAIIRLLQKVEIEAERNVYKTIMSIASTKEPHRHAYDYCAMQLAALCNQTGER